MSLKFAFLASLMLLVFLATALAEPVVVHVRIQRKGGWPKNYDSSNDAHRALENEWDDYKDDFRNGLVILCDSIDYEYSDYHEFATIFYLAIGDDATTSCTNSNIRALRAAQDVSVAFVKVQRDYDWENCFGTSFVRANDYTKDVGTCNDIKTSYESYCYENADCLSNECRTIYMNSESRLRCMRSNAISVSLHVGVAIFAILAAFFV